MCVLEGFSAESGRVEILAAEVILNKEKWICSIYKQPKVTDAHIVGILESIMNTSSNDSVNLVVCGDFNVFPNMFPKIIIVLMISLIFMV